MNLEKVLNETKSSPAIQTLISEMWETVDNVRNGQIKYPQGAVELAGFKHMIQGMLGLWHFDGREKNLPQQIKEVKKLNKK